MLEFCTLGTGGTLPIPDRALSSLYIRVNGRGLLIDCGEGTQVGIRRLGWGFRCIDGLLLTHFHGDHCTGVAGLLLSLEKAGRDEPFHIWGPKGLKRVIDGLCIIVPPLGFQVLLHELPAAGEKLEIIGLKIQAFPVDHGGIPCYGFRISLPRGASFDPEKAKAYNIPVRNWKKLQDGGTVVADGRIVRAADVTGPERQGITFVFCTDTRPCETLLKYAQDADMLILEGMYGAAEKLPQALKNHHMMFSEAAEIARKTQPGGLLLTHFSTSVDDPEEYLADIRSIFANTWAAHDGETVVMRYPIGKEKAWISLC